MSAKVKMTQEPVAELEQRYGVKAKDGTLDYKGGKYYLVVGRKRTELDPRQLVTPKPLTPLFQTKATVRVIGTTSGFIIIIWNEGIKLVPIICYKPANVLAQRLGAEVRNAILKTFVAEKEITSEFASEIERAS